MGYIYRYNCICGYMKEAHVGVGLQGVNLNLIGKYFKDDADIIIANKASVKGYIVKNQLGTCGKCKKLQIIPSLEYILDGEKLTRMGNCPDCHGSLELCDDTQQVKCPICRELMKYENIGHWD